MRIEDIFFTRIPHAKLKLLLRMAKTLVRDAPDSERPALLLALARLKAHIETIDAALAKRLRLKNPHLIARELEFDRALDVLWLFLRDYLQGCARAYGHPGLAGLSPARQQLAQLDQRRAAASAAAELYEQLFAAEGASFVRMAMHSQAEEMATRLRIIAEDGLPEQLEQCHATHIHELLRVCQEQYEELVEGRMRRELGVQVNFRELRERLRWLVLRYKEAVQGLYDEDDPASEQVVKDSLRALLILSAHLTRGGGAAAEAELDEQLVESPEFEELEALLEQAELDDADTDEDELEDELDDADTDEDELDEQADQDQLAS